MSQFFSGKVVAVTGGTDGIGKAMIDELVTQGARIATCGRSHDKIYNLQMQYASVLLHAVVCDVSIEQDCKKFIDSTIDTFGGIDILINNAGISMRALVKDVELDVIRRIMDVNFYGAVYCTKYALPSIIERKGTIVGISSVAGIRGLPGRSGYSASKFALQGWLESLRTELMDDEVNVMWVCPGFTTSNIRFTALNEKGDSQIENPMDENKMMSAAECARIILKAVEKHKRNPLITYQAIQTSFLNKFFPSLTDKLVHRFYFKNGKLVK
ncbi:MAG: SDR family oxidoreductase [Williamsia sp.]|nr:SDR family oxidoreductase [Williamsia sp.]